ncbi:MAG: UDP-N-acetylmuramoyl-tripeptide--D-alanyl-D-alanine ligase [Gammaproteobacteria bacterium]|nr:UDP-N-acetylmuramoyl-tripeptide--D-alanyl-D-alanine ligase [Gammaproteobacteria bacterium]
MPCWLSGKLDSICRGVVVPDTRPAMGTLASHWRHRFQCPLIAITGSNGKTTVKEMLRAILGGHGRVLCTSGNLNNDIGVPLTLYELDAEHDYAVIEMGANHPGEIDYLTRVARPDIALITQCAPAHLEGFGSVEGVARAKGEIFDGLGKDGCAVINADDAFADLWRRQNSDRRRLSFGLAADADVRATDIAANHDGGQSFHLITPLGDTDVSLPLPGRHNVMNALAAAAAVTALEFSPETIATGLAGLQPVTGRLIRVPGRGGSVLIDDSYNANPGSLAAALEVLTAEPGRPWLVLGDMGELGSTAAALHSSAGEQARALGVERLYGIGELSRHAVTAFGAGARHFDSMADLIDRLKDDAGEGVVVLVKGSRAAPDGTCR